MRAFMLAGAPTSIRKRSQLDSGHAEAVFVRSKLQWGQAFDSAIRNLRCLLPKTTLDRILRANDCPRENRRIEGLTSIWFSSALIRLVVLPQTPQARRTPILRYAFR